NPDRPIKMLAGLANGRRSTAKSWATGHRRAPIAKLKILQDPLKGRQAALFGLIAELDLMVMRREVEPRRRTGFNEIRVRDGPGSAPRDGRNRLWGALVPRCQGFNHKNGPGFPRVFF